MPADLFVYGTLRFPEVVLGLTGTTYPQEPARLSGYACYAIRGTIVPQRGKTVQGLLLCGVGSRALRIFDAFEEIRADVYRKQRVVVRLSSLCAFAFMRDRFFFLPSLFLSASL